MLVVTALFASMLSQYAQGGRIAYVAVETDKYVFTQGENITFRFVPLSSGVDFSTSGVDPRYGGSGNYGIGSGVHIIRIPDGREPDDIINNRTVLDMVQSWDSSDMTVYFNYFNSTDGTKSLSWNGTVMDPSYYFVQGLPVNTYHKALAGYYLIYPIFTSLSGHYVKFQLDRKAIFYLDTLKLTSVPRLDGANVSYNETVNAPPSMNGSSHCTMSWSVDGMTAPGTNGTDTRRAEFDLAPGESHSFTIKQPAYLYSGMQSFRLTGWIDTAWGNYTFSRSYWYIDGRWNDNPQYLYGVY